MNTRLITALVAYAVLMGAACFVMSGRMRYFVLIIFAWLAAKTLVAHFRPKD